MLTAEPRVEAMRGRLYPQRRTMGGDRKDACIPSVALWVGTGVNPQSTINLTYCMIVTYSIKGLGTMLTAEPRVEPSYERTLVCPANIYKGLGTMLTAEPRVEAMRGRLYPQRRTIGGDRSTMLTAEPRVEAMRGRLYPQRRTMGGDRSEPTINN
ncbi:hypothetical protein J6590_089980 [Homalodisca vitripennis]|nr:hypothetical protein J6590_089980 [Homalodisca vitripennis]